jgi:hypothetical protein
VEVPLVRSLALSIALLLAAPAHALPPYAEDPGAVSSQEEDPFSWEIPAAVVHPGKWGRLTLRLVVPEGYVVYQDQLEVRVLDAGPLRSGPLDLPPARVEPDPVDGTGLRRQYPVDVMIYLPVEVPSDARGGVLVRLETRHQGCRKGLCFSPVTLSHDVWVAVRPETEATEEQ